MYKKQETTQEPLSRIGLCFTYEQLNITTTFQGLFIRLGTLMRNTINSWIQRNPNFNATSQNLMSIPGEFQNAMVLFYGPEVANRINGLMTSFISNIYIILDANSSNNQELVNQSVQKWYRDANELSAFLDSINIFWTAPQWQNLFNQFIQSMLTIMTSLYTGEYDREQEIFNRVFDLAVIMGNFMAQGIIARDLLREVPPQKTPQTQCT